MWLCQLLGSLFLANVLFCPRSRIWSNKIISQMGWGTEKRINTVSMFHNFGENSKFFIFISSFKSFDFSLLPFSSLSFDTLLTHFLSFVHGRIEKWNKKEDAFPLVRIFPVYSTPIRSVEIRRPRDKSARKSSKENGKRIKSVYFMWKMVHARIALTYDWCFSQAHTDTQIQERSTTPPHRTQANKKK